MNYCKPTTKTTAEPYTLRQLKADNSKVIFPDEWFDGSLAVDVLNPKLADYDVYPYTIPEQLPLDATIERMEAGKIVPVKGEWVLQWVTIPLDQDELAAAAKQTERAAKLTGIEIEGVMCSATRDDMTGLNAVEDYILAGNNVNFEFSNGNVLALSGTNIDSFRAAWVPFRASFF